MSETSKSSHESGFTLVEIAIVLLISGMFMIAAAQFVKLYTVNAQYETTIEHADMTQDVLFEYFARNGAYPCPANPNLAPGDPNYGIEQCRDFADIDDYNNNRNNCTGMKAGISCPAPGSSDARDVDGDGVSDIVVIGAFPFRTVANSINGLADGIANTPYAQLHKKDGYGTLFSYAVTESMTNTNPENSVITPASPYIGAIVIEDENDVSLTEPRGAAHYVLLSHGDNRKGGYSQDGQQSEDCILTTAHNGTDSNGDGIPDGDLDLEMDNCNFDNAIFVKSARALAPNDDYYDDLIFYKASESVPVWRTSINSPQGESYIYNANEGAARVGTDTVNPNNNVSPSNAKMHVIGNVRAEEKAVAVSYCDGESETCLDPEDLGGIGSQCSGANEVAYAISGGKVICTTVNWSNPGIICPITDGEQTYIHAITNKGRITCCFSDGSGCANYQ